MMVLFPYRRYPAFPWFYYMSYRHRGVPYSQSYPLHEPHPAPRNDSDHAQQMLNRGNTDRIYPHPRAQLCTWNASFSAGTRRGNVVWMSYQGLLIHTLVHRKRCCIIQMQRRYNIDSTCFVHFIISVIFDVANRPCLIWMLKNLLRAYYVSVGYYLLHVINRCIWVNMNKTNLWY